MHTSFLRTPPTGGAINNGIAELGMLLEPGSAPGFAVLVNDFPAHGGGPPAHHHNSYDEAFYVLVGEMEFCVDGTTARATAGSMAFVPRGSTHAFRNPCDEPARLLVITTPEAIDLILRMHEVADDPEARRALFELHDSGIDGPALGAVAQAPREPRRAPG